MRIRTFIKQAHRRFGRHPFTSGQFLRDHAYEVYDITAGSIYTVINKAWKMGLLSREPFRGNSYLYRITDWGVRYIEDGDRFRDYDVWLKLLDYITKYGDEADLKWAEEALAPRLLQRFLPGKKAQDIDPAFKILEAADNAPKILKMRIRNEATEPDEEFQIEYSIDIHALSSLYVLMLRLYGRGYPDLDLDKVKGRMRETVEKSIDEVENPHRFMVMRGLGQDTKRAAKLRSGIEERPNKRDRARLDATIKRLKDLKQRI